MNVRKRITGGASFYGQTDCYGTLEFVKKHGFISCGSGDDHTLNRIERQIVHNHDPQSGDLTLPAGKLNFKAPK